MTKEELQNFLIYEAEYDENEVENMTPFQLVDAYFSYEGVYGFTEDFLKATAAAYEVELSDLED